MPEPFLRWMAITDNHGDMIAPQAEQTAREFCKWFKPHRRIHMGDVWDFRALRRGAGDEEKREIQRLMLQGRVLKARDGFRGGGYIPRVVE